MRQGQPVRASSIFCLDPPAKLRREADKIMAESSTFMRSSRKEDGDMHSQAGTSIVGSAAGLASTQDGRGRKDLRMYTTLAAGTGRWSDDVGPQPKS